MQKKVLALVVLAVCFAQKGYALTGDELINQFHFFYGQSSISPQVVNDSIESEGLDKFTKLTQYGLQANRNFFTYLNLGLRLTKRDAATDSSASSLYNARLDQLNLVAMADVPLVNNDTFRFNLFTGVGLSTTTYTVKTATQDGSLNQPSSNIFQGGASLAIGRKYVFFKIEAGYEYNKVQNLNKLGTVSGSVDKLDLSGSYFNVGILIDGLKLGKL